jgi:hypothetical protein
VPTKASRSNGNGRCKVHPRTATACRACLVQRLQEFRLTNLRAGLRIAAERISALRADYAAKGNAEVKAALVAYELGTLLARLQVADDQVQDLPGDAGVIHRATRQASSGHAAVGRAS